MTTSWPASTKANKVFSILRFCVRHSCATVPTEAKTRSEVLDGLSQQYYGYHCGAIRVYGQLEFLTAPQSAVELGNGREIPATL
ncbi:hypothetical protein EIP91_006215, partial [Steccherinum ochraceum]